MKKIISIILFLPLFSNAQYLGQVGVTPNGGKQFQALAPGTTGQVLTQIDGTHIGFANGGGGISGLSDGYLPVATSSTTLGNSWLYQSNDGTSGNRNISISSLFDIDTTSTYESYILGNNLSSVVINGYQSSDLTQRFIQMGDINGTGHSTKMLLDDVAGQLSFSSGLYPDDAYFSFNNSTGVSEIGDYNLHGHGFNLTIDDQNKITKLGSPNIGAVIEIGVSGTLRTVSEGDVENNTYGSFVSMVLSTPFQGWETNFLQNGTGAGIRTGYVSSPYGADITEIGDWQGSVNGCLLLINDNAQTMAVTNINTVTFGQASIGVNATPNTSSQLDLESTTKGFLEPQMTTTQRNAISTPKQGLQVYDNSLNAPYFYNGTSWSPVAALDTIQYYTPTTGNTISALNSLTNLNQLIAAPSGSLLALTINFPTNPSNGQQFCISITQIITTLTLSGGSNTIDGTITTSAVNSFGTWIYRTATTTWYKRG